MVHPAIQELLEEYGEVFKEPKGLPPSWSHDHKIRLHDEAMPTCVKPYHYHDYQKEEIEKLVREMLNS